MTPSPTPRRPGFQLQLDLLLILIVALALGLAMLRSASKLWAATSVTASLISLLVAAGFAIHRTGRTRARAIGYLFCGAIYWLITLGPPGTRVADDSLLTTGALTIAEPWLVAPRLPRATLDQQPQGEITAWEWWTMADRSRPFHLESFHRIGHSLFTLFVALAGAGLFGYLQGTREAAPQANPASPPAIGPERDRRRASAPRRLGLQKGSPEP